MSKEIIDIGPKTWTEYLKPLLMLALEGSATGKSFAAQELQRMATVADMSMSMVALAFDPEDVKSQPHAETTGLHNIMLRNEVIAVVPTNMAPMALELIRLGFAAQIKNLKM